jgi:hypothetical protein
MAALRSVLDGLHRIKTAWKRNFIWVLDGAVFRHDWTLPEDWHARVMVELYCRYTNTERRILKSIISIFVIYNGIMRQNRRRILTIPCPKL